jgi:hypothetical protein
VGGFRLPAAASNGDTFEFGGRQLAYNPARNSLYVGSRAGRVAEVSIPSPVQTTNPAAMPFSSYLQPFADPTEGRLSQVAGDGAALDSLLVHNGRLYGTASVFYDALNLQNVSHYSRSLRLDEPSFQGWSRVWESGKTGFVSGSMAAIPQEWQTILGGAAATGQCCIPIVSRTSWGPSAFAFNPAHVGQPVVPAAPLLYYTADHHTLGDWNAQNDVYGLSTFMGGMAIIAGTRTALYFGRNGLGSPCYGLGTSDPNLHGKPSPEGSTLYCYDPTSADKGTHAYPYRYQIWAYDLNQFAAVKAGTKAPWDVEPYAVWPLELPTPESTVRLGGVGYDAANQLLYLSQLYADRDGYAFRPVIHVLHLNAAGAPVDEAPPADDPPSDGSGTVSSVSLAVNRNAPQAAGTAITFTASATGGAMPLEYKWLIDRGSGFVPVTTWSTIDSFTWTPSTPNPQYRVGVWARSGGNTKDAAEASASMPFAITQPTPLRGVTIAADKPAPQVAGTSIQFTATASGGAAPLEYKWMIFDGSPTWKMNGWTASNRFTWTPSTPRPDYAIRVWVRSHGSTREEPEADTYIAFPIDAPVPVLVKSVTLGTNKPAPQILGASISFTAMASGGVAPVQYKFLLYDGSPTWRHLTGWTTSNTFMWTPSSANQHYAIRVWARSSNNAKDEPEAEAQFSFPIDSNVPTPISGVTLATNKPSPQVAGTTIVATATVRGGAAPYTFRWLVHDGVSWKVVTGWTTSNTFTWTPTRPNSGHFIGVWVRSAGNTKEEPEATWSLPFVIK